MYLDMEPMLVQIRLGLFLSVNVILMPILKLFCVRLIFLVVTIHYYRRRGPTSSYYSEERLAKYCSLRNSTVHTSRCTIKYPFVPDF